MKKITVFILLFTNLIYSQNRYSTVTTSEFKPMSYDEIMSVPQALQKKYDANQKYLYSMKKSILDLRPQIKETKFLDELNAVYSTLTSLEDGDLARSSNSLIKCENRINEIISDYNTFISNNNSNTNNTNNSNNNNSNNNNSSYNNLNSSSQNYAQLGVKLFQEKEYAKSVINFSKHLETDKYNTDIMFYRALAKSELGDKYGAINDYEKIIELNSNYPLQYTKLATVYNNKAYSLVKLKKYQEALPFVEKALELDKSEWFIWDTRGEIYYNLNNYEKSLKDLNKAIELKENENSYFLRGLVYIKLAQKEKGCKDLSKSGELGNTEAYEKIKINCN